MGRLARKEGAIKVILLLVPLLVSCSPIITTTSLVHSIAKGDAFGTVTGVITNLGSNKPKPEPPKKQSRAEIMEDLRKALEDDWKQINGSSYTPQKRSTC